MDILTAFGLSASAGLNAYIPLLVVALLARFTDLYQLAEPWNALESWWTIGILVVLVLVEFFADKIPAVNHINDIIQTLVRPTAGAILFAASTSVVSDLQPVLGLILGLFVAGSVHAVKTVAVRPAVTATTGGAGNVPVSVAEDIISTVLSVIAAVMPVIIATIMVLVTALIVWWIWRRINAGRMRKT
jgi:hypothetical protein